MNSDGAVNRNRLYSLFSSMVNIYSPSGREEELANYLAGYLDGFSRLPLITGKESIDESRVNLTVSGSAGKKDTLFLGHIDTVPAFSIEQYEFHEKGGLCFGLGTADMKGGCAALVEAFISASEERYLPDNVMLALVAGEEETGDGTEALLENHDFKNAIIAEPTNLIPCFEHYSYIEMIVRIFGYRQHAAMASRETGAIRKMLRFLLDLENRIDREKDTILNIRDLHSSESGFAVPDQCISAVDFHFPPRINASDYSEKLESFISKHFASSGTSRYEIDFPVLADGYTLSTDAEPAPVIKKVYEKLNLDFTCGSFMSHSDANLLSDKGCSPVILGPGQLSRAHTVDEAVDFEDVVRAAVIYTEILKSMAGR